MVQRTQATSPWVAEWGYSRAVRHGNVIEVGGTTSLGPDGKVVGVGDPYAQARHALGIVIAAVEQLGGRRQDIARTRVFVRDVADWRAIGRAHRELLGDVLPASSCVGGLDFLAPELLLEIEATAVLEDA